MSVFKRPLVLLCTAALLFGSLSVPVTAQQSAFEAEIIGCGTVMAPADSVTIRFEVVSYGATLEKAQTANQKLTDRITKTLTDYGTPVREGYYTSEGFSGTRFLVTRCLSLTTDRTEDTDAICESLIASGASALFEVSYACRDLSAFEEEAMRLAVADAQRKAEALGVTLPLAEIQDLGCYACGFSYASTSDTPAVRVECSLRLCYRQNIIPTRER